MAKGTVNNGHTFLHQIFSAIGRRDLFKVNIPASISVDDELKSSFLEGLPQRPFHRIVPSHQGAIPKSRHRVPVCAEVSTIVMRTARNDQRVMTPIPPRVKFADACLHGRKGNL